MELVDAGGVFSGSNLPVAGLVVPVVQVALGGVGEVVEVLLVVGGHLGCCSGGCGMDLFVVGLYCGRIVWDLVEVMFVSLCASCC